VSSGANPFSPVLALGVSKSGKTYGMQRRIRDILSRPPGWAAVVAVDVNAEWPGELLRGVRCAKARTPRTLARALAAGHRLVIFAPEPDWDSDTPHRESVQAAAALVGGGGPARLLVVPECHLSIPEGKPLGRAVAALVHAGRHPATRGAIWADTQHPADMPKTLIKEAREIDLYATGAVQDLDYFRRMGGRELVTAIKRCAALMESGARGYHVRVRPLTCMPPYRIER